MPLSEKLIKEVVEENRRYLDALEESDKLGRLPVVRKKVRKDFTIDEDIFMDFQERCRKLHVPMSRIVEDLIRRYLKETAK